MLQTGELLLRLLAVWIPPVAATDYCKDVVCESKHTLCKYPDDTPGDECLSFAGKALDDEQIADLLQVHNRYREYVAAGKETRALGGSLPQAANIGALTWDGELARIAQRWAQQCQFGHDECRALPHMAVGQNLAISGNTNRLHPNVTKMALMWYEEEVVSYDTQGDTVFRYTKETSHFTQWIWARTYKLGCGYSGYLKDKMHMNFLVCNYGPAGNIEGTHLYRAGPPCSACPGGTTCGSDSRYPSLCHSDTGGVPDLGKAEIVGSPGSASQSRLLPTALGVTFAANIAIYLCLTQAGHT